MQQSILFSSQDNLIKSSNMYSSFIPIKFSILPAGKWVVNEHKIRRNPLLTHRVRAHGLGVRGEGEESEAVEDDPVEEAVDHVLGRQQHDEHHHELGVEDQEPGDDAAHDAAAVTDEPHGVRAGAGRGRGAVFGLQVASLPLDVPGAVRRALHPTAPVAPTTYCGD